MDWTDTFKLDEELCDDNQVAFDVGLLTVILTATEKNITCAVQFLGKPYRELECMECYIPHDLRGPMPEPTPEPTLFDEKGEGI